MLSDEFGARRVSDLDVSQCGCVCVFVRYSVSDRLL